MNSPRVLLIQPNYQRNANADSIDNIVGVHPPLGLLYIAAVLRQAGLRPEILDANLKRLSPTETAGAAVGYDIVGVSVLNQAHDQAIEIARRLPPTVTKICGGPHATAYPEAMLKGGFDAVVRGEGEIATLRIAQGDALGVIPSLTWKRDGNVVHNPAGDPVDVASLPFPARDLLEGGGTRWPYASAGTQAFPWAPVLTSRGCPFACYYCNKSIHGFRFRSRPAQDVVGEIVDLVERYGVREIDIVDDIFNWDVGRAIAICDGIVSSGVKIRMRFGNGIRADRITPELAKKLKAAGVCYVAFGLESGAQEILDSIPKRITLDEVRAGVRMIQDVGIHTTGLFMLGLLHDNAETMQKTIDFARELRLDLAYFSLATPYPGTEFFDIISKEGRLVGNRWEDFNHSYGRLLYEHPDAPSRDLAQAYFRKAYRQFYLRPGYVLRQMLRYRTREEMRVMVRGVRDLARNLFLRGGER
jgi:radical SAM superfamily enzyme YgiQ (UPF0313 family)